jgi:hypothetical protein
MVNDLFIINSLQYFSAVLLWFYFYIIHLAFLSFIHIKQSLAQVRDVAAYIFFHVVFAAFPDFKIKLISRNNCCLIQVASISELTLYGLTTLAVLLGLLQMRG